jgi:hypothetical protein
MNKADGKKRRNVVSTLISDEALEKLNRICFQLERSKSWVLSRLILEADIDRLREKNEGGGL